MQIDQFIYLEGEIVKLLKFIKVDEGENKGAVEKWLN